MGKALLEKKAHVEFMCKFETHLAQSKVGIYEVTGERQPRSTIQVRPDLAQLRFFYFFSMYLSIAYAKKVWRLKSTFCFCWGFFYFIFSCTSWWILMYWFDEGEKMVREKVILHIFLYKKKGVILHNIWLCMRCNR